MDPWAVHVKDPTRTAICWKNQISRQMGKAGVLEMMVFRRKFSPSGYSLVLRAKARKNNDRSSSSSSSGDGDQSVPESNDSKRNNSSQRPYRANMDWREFRAHLLRQEQVMDAAPDAHEPGETPYKPKPVGLKWAHPIPVPETGCVLIATEKLDGVQTFERSVVLLLRSGTRHPQEGPFGVIINHPLQKNIGHIKPTNNGLANTFGDCSLHFGGPLEASMFMLKTGSKSKTKLAGFEEIVPGVCFGSRNCLDEAAAIVKKGLLKPQDFRFFVGYAGWHFDQLREEIESGYWHLAACSSNLICGGSSERLWEEILQLMGGRYSELSRKPKQDI